MKLSWSKAESKAQDRAEYRWRPVLRQELKGKEEERQYLCYNQIDFLFSSWFGVMRPSNLVCSTFSRTNFASYEESTSILVHGLFIQSYKSSCCSLQPLKALQLQSAVAAVACPHCKASHTAVFIGVWLLYSTTDLIALVCAAIFLFVL